MLLMILKKRRPSSACRRQRYAIKPSGALSVAPNLESAGSSSKLTLSPTCASSILTVGKRRQVA